MKVLVVDIGGTKVKVLATGRGREAGSLAAGAGGVDMTGRCSGSGTLPGRGNRVVG